jgi:intracellular multiplication protein IcmE
MAGRKENLKSLFTNTRTRVIIVFTMVILLTAVIIGFFKFYKSSEKNLPRSTVAFTPGIQSIPGALNPTVQYAKLQEAQNVTQAETALKGKSSAIPTIVRSQQLGMGVNPVGSQNGTGGLGFSALAREDEAGLQRSAWIQDLQNNSCSKSSMANAVNQGAQLSDLKKACSCIQLKDNGYQVRELDKVCSCKELRAAGFNARQLKDAGFSAGRLRSCGFDACELRNAGFTAQEMKDGGFSDDEMKGAGFTPEEIARASGLPDGVTEADVRKVGCDPTGLAKLRASGVSAAAIRRISGCSIDQLKAAGFTAQELKQAGFTAADLKKAGFTPEQLRQAGFSARDLLNAGFTPKELEEAGFTKDAIKEAEDELPPGISPDDIKKAGCDVDALRSEKLAGVSAKLIRQNAGCGAQALKAAGFTDEDLANANFTPQQIALRTPDDAAIRAAGCDPVKLNNLLNQGVSATKIHELNGCNAEQLKAAGFSAKSLIDAGFSPQDLAAAGFTPDQIRAGLDASDKAIKAAGCNPARLKELLNSGVSAKRIHELNGCSASQLKAAGFGVKSLLDAGFTPQDLAAAGFDPEQIKEAMKSSDAAIAASDCDPVKLKVLYNQGVSATKIHELNGCSASQLKAAGFDAKSLADAGFSAQDLAAAGFTPSEVRAGMAASDNAIKAAGCDPTRLKALHDSGVSAKRIHDLNGCSASQLKEAGYDTQALAKAGFTPQEIAQAGAGPAGIIAEGRKVGCTQDALRAARAAGVSASTIRQTLGCSAEAMKAAGYTAGELKAAGFTAAELKGAGFSAADLKAAGFSAKELRAAGFSAQALKAAGFSPSQLKEAGFSAADLKAAGFTANQLKAAGYSAQELKNAGFTASELKAAGFTAQDLKNAGFTAEELRKGGYTPQDLLNAGYSGDQIKTAGYSKADLAQVGITGSQVEGLAAPNQQQATTPAIPSISGAQGAAQAGAQTNNAKQLQDILKRQNTQLADQKYQQKIQQRSSAMLSSANQALQGWKAVSTQTYVGGSAENTKGGAGSSTSITNVSSKTTNVENTTLNPPDNKIIIKTGDVLFAVIDTSVNSDEPGPILATIVSGKLKGAKLIGSFNLPTNANKMIISFNTMSVPGAKSSTSISAYAIDANTARTALSSDTNHHYLLRYGSLFASSFLEGFGNAFQSANTTITIGGSGSGNNTTTIQGGGAGQSALENAVIGLATVGKNWGQVAQTLVNRPTTVQVYSGTGIGVLFTQDLHSL